MFYELIQALIPLVRGIDDTARAELAEAISKHKAEHDAVVADLQDRQDRATALAPAAPVTEGNPA